MRAMCISSINQHCVERERGMLIKQSKKYCKCSKTFGRDCTCSYNQAVPKHILMMGPGMDPKRLRGK